MTTFLKSRLAAWLIPALILAAAAAVLVLAPAERTLGQNVKIVYTHVALSRAGSIGFYAGGLLGLAVLVTASERLAGWMRALSWAALALFGAGFLVSGLAQIVSWGGIAWREPRVEGALNLLAVAAAVQVINTWLNWPRGRGGLHVLLAAFLLWTEFRTLDILHPGRAIGESGSSAMQAAGVILLTLSLLLGAWLVWLLRPRPAPS